MFRMWAKLFKESHILRDVVIENDSAEMSRTAKVFAAVDDICRRFDLAKPIWLDKNIKEFKKLDKTRFSQDSFIETIPFDYMEIQVIEEDED